ncbi:type II toxin-antitoxin system VapC family toxin [Neorhizobium sp. DT-125]|uniref:type II toxin-antitoxin system VapC family toxin n=1 Tax=Neorhizobium sp. DT-125 TaxID=3396163 RepID=UPI003F1D83D6
MYILDTNILSEFRRRKPHGAVLAWLASVPSSSLYFASISAGEIQAGIEMTRRNDPQKAEEIEQWLDAIIASVTCLDANADVFREWARLMHGRSDHMIEDCLIAATAVVHRMIVVTRNVRDFEDLSVPVLNPFEHKT